MKPIPHGTESGYRRGCKCDPCKASHNERIRLNQQQRKQTKHLRLSFSEIQNLFGDEASDQHIAEVIGINRQSVRRYRAEGMSLTVADRVATKLGFHPLSIWQHKYWTAQ